jgi:hypothetical protein
MNASLWAFVPNWAVFWFSYEALKRRLSSPPAAGSPSGSLHTSSAAHVASAFGAGKQFCTSRARSATVATWGPRH